MKALPWLRLYTEIIDDEKLGLLSFEDRWHFVAILCLKGKGVLDGETDPEMLQRKVALKIGLSIMELEKMVKRLSRMGLIDAETFQPVAWASRQMQSDKDETNAQRQKRYRDAHKAPVTPSNALRNGAVTRIEEETDTDTEEDSTQKAGALCPHQSIVDLYHQTIPSARRVKEWTPARQQQLRARWREKEDRQTLEWWGKFFGYVAKSDFLCGRTEAPGRKPFELSLDWLCKSANFVKVLEGAYE